MTIGFDARLMSVPGGIPRYCSELLLNLTEKFPETNFVIIVKKIPEFFPKRSNIRWVITDIHWYTIKEQLKLGVLMNAQTDVDLWHIPHWNVPITLKKPFVMTFHDFIFEEFPTHGNRPLKFIAYYIRLIFWRVLMRINVIRAKQIIAVSNFVAKQLVQRYEITKSKTQTVYIGLSNLPNPVKPSEEIQTPFFLVVGNSYPHKNHELVFKTILDYPRLNAHWYFITHRDRFSEANAAKARALGIDRKVHYLYDAPDTTLAWCYKNMVALVFPSYMEGFGIPPLEAFSLGKPVIAAKTSSLPEVLGNLPRWISPDSNRELGCALQEALKNEKTFSEITIAAEKECAKKFTWEAAAVATQKIYESVL